MNPIKRLKYHLDDLLDDDPFIEDFLFFDDKKSIPISYTEDYITNSDFEVSFNLKELNEIWYNIKLKNENHISDFEYSDIYIAFGLIKYNDYLMPLCFIPIDFVEKEDEVKCYRNKNFNIPLNFCINDELHNVELPSFNGNLIEFIHQIDEIDGIKLLKKAYIGNFNLNIINLCNEFDTNFDNILDKSELFFNKIHFLDSSKVINLNNDLALKWPDLDLKINYLNMDNAHILIKNLLGDGKSILFISDRFQRQHIEKGLYLSGIKDLVLSYSELSESYIYYFISKDYPINITDNDDFSKLNEKLSLLEECCEVLNRKYYQLQLTPRDIKSFKDKYYAKIKDIPHDFPIKNAKTYKSNYFNKLKKQLITVINNEDVDIELYLTDDFFNSTDYNIFKNISNSFENNLNTFIEINNQINEVYGIKIFENLFEVRYLDNLSVLNESNNKFIEKKDRFELNKLLKIRLYSSEDNDTFKNIFDKYEINENSIESIENYIIYSELIDYNIFNDEELIRNNLSAIVNDLKVLSKINKYLLKQLDYVKEFYQIFKCFETPKDLFNLKISISNIKEVITTFKHDLIRLEKCNGTSVADISDINVKNYFNYWKTGKIKKEHVEYVFSYNFYNSILNDFLDKFDYIDEDKITSSYYKYKYKEVYSELKEKERNQFEQSIYLRVNDLNQNKDVIKQKEDWDLKKSNGKSILAKDLLSNYKDYIFSNKRVFMVNIELVPLIFDKTYENFFDYALICTDDTIDDLFNLSVLLRTKNKLIKVAKVNNHGK